MKRIVLLAFLKAFVISIGFTLISILYGSLSGNSFKISLVFEVIFFIVMFFGVLIGYLWNNRKK